MVKNLIKENRLFSILHDRVRSSEHFDQNLSDFVIDYIDEYSQYKGLAEADLEDIYVDYIKRYNKDLKIFKTTGLFPFEITGFTNSPNRVSYNIILLLSIIMSAHRLRIMQIINNYSENVLGPVMVIGCGPGFEIELLKKNNSEIDAFDLEIDPFLISKHPEVAFKCEYFDGRGSKKYNSIFLIELLEHLDRPYEILANCNNVLNTDGRVFLTTATDIPQFDHLYNFEGSHVNFDLRVQEIGFKVEFMEDIPHKYLTSDFNSKNRFYTLKK